MAAAVAVVPTFKLVQVVLAAAVLVAFLLAQTELLVQATLAAVAAAVAIPLLSMLLVVPEDQAT